MCAKSHQSGLSLCNPMDSSPPGSSVYGTPQARILKWVAISFSRGSFQPRDQTCIGRWILYHWATRGDPPLKESYLRSILLLFSEQSLYKDKQYLKGFAHHRQGGTQFRQSPSQPNSPSQAALFETVLLGLEPGTFSLYLAAHDSLSKEQGAQQELLREEGWWIQEPRLYGFVVLCLSLKHSKEV